MLYFCGRMNSHMFCLRCLSVSSLKYFYMYVVCCPRSDFYCRPCEIVLLTAYSLLFLILTLTLMAVRTARGRLPPPAPTLPVTTDYTECWPCLFFDTLLSKYFPAG
jgi:hypothetical protein